MDDEDYFTYDRLETEQQYIEEVTYFEKPTNMNNSFNISSLSIDTKDIYKNKVISTEDYSQEIINIISATCNSSKDIPLLLENQKYLEYSFKTYQINTSKFSEAIDIKKSSHNYTLISSLLILKDNNLIKKIIKFSEDFTEMIIDLLDFGKRKAFKEPISDYKSFNVFTALHTIYIKYYQIYYNGREYFPEKLFLFADIIIDLMPDFSILKGYNLIELFNINIDNDKMLFDEEIIKIENNIINNLDNNKILCFEFLGNKDESWMNNMSNNKANSYFTEHSINKQAFFQVVDYFILQQKIGSCKVLFKFSCVSPDLASSLYSVLLEENIEVPNKRKILSELTLGHKNPSYIWLSKLKIYIVY